MKNCSAMLFLNLLIFVIAFPVWAANEIISVGANKNMKATLFTPDGAGPFPGVLVLHTSGGLQDGDLF